MVRLQDRLHKILEENNIEYNVTINLSNTLVEHGRFRESSRVINKENQNKIPSETQVPEMILGVDEGDRGGKTYSKVVLEALKRGQKARQALICAEKGAVSARKFGPLVGISHTEVHNRRKNGELIGIEMENRIFLFPLWQIDGHGRILRGLPEIIRILKEAGADDIALIGFFLESHSSLEGKRPLDILREGDIEDVKEAASTWGKHGAR